VVFVSATIWKIAVECQVEGAPQNVDGRGVEAEGGLCMYKEVWFNYRHFVQSSMDIYDRINAGAAHTVT